MMRTGRQVARIACALLMVALSCAAQEKQAGAQTLSAEERRIADYVDAHFEDAVRLLEQTVNVESATQNLEGVKRVGRIFQSEFRARGFNAKWIEMPPQMGRAGHFFAEHTGTRGRRLLLIGHLDTVLEGKRFVRDGQVARGSGTVDMKGGDIVLLYALKALHSTGALRGSRIIVIMTGDEENVGSPLEVSRPAQGCRARVRGRNREYGDRRATRLKRLAFTGDGGDGPFERYLFGGRRERRDL